MQINGIKHNKKLVFSRCPCRGYNNKETIRTTICMDCFLHFSCSFLYILSLWESGWNL